jgi:hypothetical protein
MTDWSTTASLATAGGTLVLAVATFASTRSANRAARMAERAVLAGLRPLLLTAHRDDRPEKVMWMDEHFAVVPGGQAVVEAVDGNVYLAVNLRNAGNGIAVLHGWRIYVGWDPELPPTPIEDFRRQGRDLYIPAGDTGFWQGAIRELDDPLHGPLTGAAADHPRVSVDLLYGDLEGGQRTITRFGLTWHADVWIASASRHWNVDRDDPR